MTQTVTNVLPPSAPSSLPQTEPKNSLRHNAAMPTMPARSASSMRLQTNLAKTSTDRSDASTARLRFLATLEEWIKSAPLTEKQSRQHAAERILEAFDQKTPALELNGCNLSSLPDNLHTLDALTHIDVSNNVLTAIPALPPALRKLMACNNQLQYLPRLPPSLKLLIAANNKLQQLPALPKALTSLNVNVNLLTTLPTLPEKLKMFMVAFNQLSQLPPDLGVILGDGVATFSNNRWSANAIRNIMTLPKYIDVIFAEAPAELGMQQEHICNSFRLWENCSSGHPGLDWQTIATEKNAAKFALFLNRLTGTIEYKNINMRSHLEQRVVNLLGSMHQSKELRRLCFCLSVDATKACCDLVAASLNDMELARINHEAAHGKYSNEELFHLGKQVFYMKLIDEIALRTIAELKSVGVTIDEIELRLRYQTALAGKLGLSSFVLSMAYPNQAKVNPAKIEMALQEITERENSDELCQFMASWSPWQQAIERANPPLFQQLHTTIFASRDAITNKPDAMSEQEWITAFQDLRRQEKEMDATLTERLTADFMQAHQIPTSRHQPNPAIST